MKRDEIAWAQVPVGHRVAFGLIAFPVMFGVLYLARQMVGSRLLALAVGAVVLLPPYVLVARWLVRRTNDARSGP